MKMPEKPKDRDEQISMIWDFLFGHVFHRIRFQDIKINFILVFVGILLGLLTVLLAFQIVN